MSQKPKHFAEDLFIGARLGAARTKAGITLEQAARETRIRVQRLREIEVDDFSGFAHPTYARLFLIDYAEYLNVPVEEIRPLLPAQTKLASAGFQYLDALGRADAEQTGYVDRNEPGQRRFRFFKFLGIFVLIILVAAGGLYFWSTIKKIERISPRAHGQAEIVGVAIEVPVEKDAPEPEPSATPELPADPPQDPELAAAPSPTPVDWQTSSLWEMIIPTDDPAAPTIEPPTDP